MNQFKTSFATLMGVWNIAGELQPDPNFKPFKRRRVHSSTSVNGSTKLTDNQVAQLRHRREVGVESIKVLAAEYGISESYCAAICSYHIRIGLKRGHVGRRRV